MQLVAAVLNNHRVLAANLANLLRPALRREDGDRIIRTFATCLPTSGIIAANLGEYTAWGTTWAHLIQAVQGSCLGHLYVSETYISNLSPQQKLELRAALRQNRKKRHYLEMVTRPGVVGAIGAVNPWWRPPATSDWLVKQLRHLELLSFARSQQL